MRPRLRLRPAVVCAALAAALAGCAPMGADYARPDPGLPSGWNAAAGSPAPQPGVATPADWWKLYRDPTLDDLVAAARERSPDARIALAQLEEAQAALREAHATLFPQVDLGASAGRNRITQLGGTPLPSTVAPVRNDFRVAASTAFELDFWGRLRRGEEAVRAQAVSAEHARAVTELSLSGATAQAYFLLRSLDAQIGFTRDSLALRAQTLAVVQARARGGLVSNLDVEQATISRSDAAAQLVELERQRTQVLHTLGALTGRPNLALAPGDLRAIPLPPTPPAGLPSALLDRRPDVRAAEQALVGANARVGVAKASMMPTISLTGSFGGQSRELSDLLDRGARIWSLGFAVTLPIFDSGRLAARTEQAEARQRQALAGYQKAAESAFREVGDALAGVRSTAEAEDALTARAEASRRAARLAELRWNAGYSAFLEVLDAQRTLNEAELALVRNRQQRLAFSVDLMKSLGGGWQAPTP